MSKLLDRSIKSFGRFKNLNELCVGIYDEKKLYLSLISSPLKFTYGSNYLPILDIKYYLSLFNLFFFMNLSNFDRRICKL